jgi:hypothetical protein
LFCVKLSHGVVINANGGPGIDRLNEKKKVLTARSVQPCPCSICGVVPGLLTIGRGRIAESLRQPRERIDGSDVKQRNLRALLSMREIADKAADQARRRTLSPSVVQRYTRERV